MTLHVIRLGILEADWDDISNDVKKSLCENMRQTKDFLTIKVGSPCFVLTLLYDLASIMCDRTCQSACMVLLFSRLALLMTSLTKASPAKTRASLTSTQRCSCGSCTLRSSQATNTSPLSPPLTIRP